VSDYGPDDWAIEVRSPAEEKGFCSSLCIQTRSEAHTASRKIGTGGPFPGGKERPGSDADNSPHLVPRLWMSRSYTSAPSWDLFTFYALDQIHMVSAREESREHDERTNLAKWQSDTETCLPQTIHN
jgi:hypothetical protein